MSSNSDKRAGSLQIARDVRRQPSAFLLFAAYKTFAALLFLQTTFLPGTFHIGHLEFPVMVALPLLCALVFLYFAIFFKRIKIVANTGYLCMLAALMTLGVLMLFINAHEDMDNELLQNSILIIGIVLVSMGLGGIHVELGRFFGMLGMTPTLTLGIASTLLASAFLFAMMFMSALALWILAFVLPAAIVLIFFQARKDIFPDRRSLYRDSSVELIIPYRFIATSIVQGLAIGAPMGLLFFQGLPSLGIDAIGYAIASALAIVVVLVFKVDFNRSIYQIGFPIVSIGLLVAYMSSPLSWIASLLQLAGYIYLDLVLWGLGSYLIKNCDQPAIWLSSCPTASLMLGRSLGMIIGSIAMQLLSNEDSLLCILAFFVMMAALLLMSGKNMRTGWGFVHPDGDVEQTDSLRTCDVIGQEFNLTQREQEIMYRIISGESRKEIAEDLFISTNTIKTHLHNLYSKLDVHSESDLKAFVSRRERMFSTEDDKPTP